MDLLFQREQTSNGIRRVKFKLWGMIELDEDEQEMVSRYQFDEAILIVVEQPNLLRHSILLGLAVSGLAFLLAKPIGLVLPVFMAIALAGLGAGFWYFNEKRETIYVRDLLHGRHFKCNSVVDLARKEAWLETVVAYLRQVMESAKHWDGTERHNIQALPKDEARQVILKGI